MCAQPFCRIHVLNHVNAEAAVCLDCRMLPAKCFLDAGEFSFVFQMSLHEAKGVFLFINKLIFNLSTFFSFLVLSDYGPNFWFLCIWAF